MNVNIIGETTQTMRSLMARMGEKVILKEDVSPSVAAKPKFPMTIKKPICVNVNPTMTRIKGTASMVRKTYVNYDITEFAQAYGKDGVTYLKRLLEREVVKRTGEQLQNNTIIINNLAQSGDTQISFDFRIDKQKPQLMMFHKLMSYLFSNNVTMDWNTLWGQVETTQGINLENTESPKFQGRLANILQSAFEMWKKLKSENPNTPDENIKVFGVGKKGETVEVSIALDPRNVQGHQLSSLNRCLIVAEAQAMGIPCPRFVCSKSMITSHVPFGFERKFKQGIEIHPYYVRFVSEHKASKRALKKMFDGDSEAQEMIENNPQTFNVLAIEHGTHNADFFGYCEYYDIDETEPIDPSNDVFENTLGYSDNLQAIANQYTDEIIKKMDEDEAQKATSVDTDTDKDAETTDDTAETVKNNSVFDALDLMKTVCDKLDCGDAYRNLGYQSLASTDVSVAERQLRNVVQNLCREMILKSDITKKHVVDTLTARTAAIIMRDLSVGAKDYVNLNELTNVEQFVVDNIHKAIVEVNGQMPTDDNKNYGAIGESLLGRCLLNAINKR